MPGFDPEATSPVSRPSADSRPDRSVRNPPERPRPAANPTADHPATATPDPERTAAPSPAPISKPPTSDPSKPPTSDPSVLPDVTTDERDLGWGELPDPSDDDRYLRDVPPHHGS